MGDPEGNIRTIRQLIPLLKSTCSIQCVLKVWETVPNQLDVISFSLTLALFWISVFAICRQHSRTIVYIYLFHIRAYYKVTKFS